MARHMVPRYVDVVDDLPRTPTEKVRTDVLRERGVDADDLRRRSHAVQRSTGQVGSTVCVNVVH